jgi:hypothetical protein
VVDSDDLDQTFVGDDDKSSAGVLASIKKAEDAFREWQNVCQDIDDLYNLNEYRTDLQSTGWQDADLDLFWSSFEVLKPAVYARPPLPVVAPLFKDGKPVENLTAELLERCAISTFTRTDINDVMIHLRDDLLFTGRGAPWVRYEVQNGNHSVCVEHKDRLDFLHDPARKWSEVGWVAGAAWMTKADMSERFEPHSGEAYEDATYSVQRDTDGREMEKAASVKKAKVWEVHHKADKKIYWVTEGVDVLLDSSDPEFKLTGFFPCPKPAYATLRRRSLIPVPDWQRYSIHFKKISELTRRIYSLLEKVQMKGLVAGGGDVAQAVNDIINDDSDMVIEAVPGAAMMAAGAEFVAWMPLAELAQAIQGLIESRSQLINDFFQLSGISDIMRGASEAQETLGAQQLKSQYGSVRVREKSAELQRVAADTVKIAAEIIAEKFPAQTLIDMSGMVIPKKAEIEKRIKDIEKEARKDLDGLGKQAQQAAQQQQQQPQLQQGQPQPQGGPQQGGQGPQPIDPQQADAALKQAQQGILAKYAPMLQEAEAQVPLEDVMKLLRDDRTRSFVFEIESSSTILTDELEEKSSRNEFMQQFTSTSQPLMAMAAMGDAGAKLAGELMKFALAPYRVGRTLDGAIDEFVDAAPEMAAKAAQQNAPADDQGATEANNTLAQAEMVKAQAAMASVQAKGQLDQATMQAKMAELQQKAMEQQSKAQDAQSKLQLQYQTAQDAAAMQEAKINNLEAQTATLLHAMGLNEQKQKLSEYTEVQTAQARGIDQALEAQRTQADNMHKTVAANRADRQQHFNETNAANQGSSNG